MALFSQESFPTARLDPTLPTGLILCGMGGPDGPTAVRPFLRNLFRDPTIFPVPRPIAPALGWTIAACRAPAVRRRYRLMSPDCVSPQMDTTARQAAAIAETLANYGLTALPAIAMRYWRPLPDETVQSLRTRGTRQYLVVPMYPQYSSATNGSTLDFVMRSLRRLHPGAPVHVVAGWGLLPGFLAALARPVAARLLAWAEAGVFPRECGLIYVAHSLPQSFIDRGDPYLAHTRATVQAVHERVMKTLTVAGHEAWAGAMLHDLPPQPSFQSRVGPIKWIGPEVIHVVRELAAAGRRRLMLQPVSFTCEHIETLIELDVELKETATHLGVEEFHRGPTLNLDAEWLKAMAAMLADKAFNAEVPLNA